MRGLESALVCMARLSSRLLAVLYKQADVRQLWSLPRGPQLPGSAGRQLMPWRMPQALCPPCPCYYKHTNGPLLRRLPVSFMPIITMRATQKNRMSCPVSSRAVG